MTVVSPDELLAEFVEGRVDPKKFPHSRHVQVSYELLGRHSFSEALYHLARGLRGIATKAGHPERYHETITVAFLSLIGERRWPGGYADFDEFAKANPDVMSKEFLSRMYQLSVLESQMARETFILPQIGLLDEVHVPRLVRAPVSSRVCEDGEGPRQR